MPYIGKPSVENGKKYIRWSSCSLEDIANEPNIDMLLDVESADEVVSYIESTRGSPLGPVTCRHSYEVDSCVMEVPADSGYLIQGFDNLELAAAHAVRVMENHPDKMGVATFEASRYMKRAGVTKNIGEFLLLSKPPTRTSVDWRAASSRYALYTVYAGKSCFLHVVYGAGLSCVPVAHNYVTLAPQAYVRGCVIAEAHPDAARRHKLAAASARRRAECTSGGRGLRSRAPLYVYKAGRITSVLRNMEGTLSTLLTECLRENRQKRLLVPSFPGRGSRYYSGYGVRLSAYGVHVYSAVGMFVEQLRTVAVAAGLRSSLWSTDLTRIAKEHVGSYGVKKLYASVMGAALYAKWEGLLCAKHLFNAHNLMYRHKLCSPGALKSCPSFCSGGLPEWVLYYAQVGHKAYWKEVNMCIEEKNGKKKTGNRRRSEAA